MFQGTVPGPAGLVALTVLALTVFVGLIAFCLWWLRRPRATFGRLGALLARGVATGTVGGLVMIPVGLFLIVIGFPVGLYSERVARWLLGFTTPSVLFIEHVVISSSLAVVLVLASAVAVRRWSASQALAWGAGYGLRSGWPSTPWPCPWRSARPPRGSWGSRPSGPACWCT